MNFQDPTLWGHVVGCYIIFQTASALVQSLPTPDEWPQGGIWYKSFRNFLSILIADFKSFYAQKTNGTLISTSGIPGMAQTTITKNGAD